MTDSSILRRVPPVAVFGLLALFPYVFPQHWLVNIAFFALMYAALAVTWNIFGGFAGYIWLGNLGFFGIGAYSIAVALHGSTLHSGIMPFFLLVPVGLGAAIIAAPIGLIMLRVRGATFALASLASLFIVQELAFNLQGITNGADGIGMPVAPFSVTDYERPFYLCMAVLLAVGMLCAWVIARSRFGLMLFAIRQDEDRACSLGVPTMRVKLIAFVVSAMFTAMIGGLWAYYISWIYPLFATDPSIMFGVVMMVFLGGRGTQWGPVVGALLVAPVQEYFALTLGTSQFYLLGDAILFLLVILLLPRGIVPTLRHWLERYRRTRREMGHGRVLTAQGERVHPDALGVDS